MKGFSNKTVVVPADELRALAVCLLVRRGVDRDECEVIVDCLLWADMAGISSHGLKLLPSYLKRFQAGLIRSPAPIKVLSSGRCWARVDGGSGFGIVVATYCTRLVTELAASEGVGMVFAGHSNHMGPLGYYAWLVARQNMVGIIATNAGASVAPWGGATPCLGTNPIALSAPTAEDPIVLDIATSVVAKNKIVAAALKGERIPEGWALDEEGCPTTSAERALRGALLPMAGHKGYGLALFVDILCGALGGGVVASEVGRMYVDFDREENLSHFFVAIDPAQVRGSEFYDSVARLVAIVRGSKRAPGFSEILLPGERELAEHRRRASQGVAVDPELYSLLTE